MNTSDLIKMWMSYASNKGIKFGSGDGRAADIDDVKKFLVSIGFQEHIVDAHMKEEYFIDTNEPDETPDDKDREFTEQEISIINQVKGVIKDKPTSIKAQLLRALK